MSETAQTDGIEVTKFPMTWEAYVKHLEALCDLARTVLARLYTGYAIECAGVYGPPRGGLIPAVYLSHQLKLPLLAAPQPGMLWVDDIVDSGDTLEKTSEGAIACLSILGRPEVVHISDTFAYVAEAPNGWTVFPYEKTDAPTERDND